MQGSQRGLTRDWNNRIILSVIAGLILVVSLLSVISPVEPVQATAGIPEIINHQGRLLNSSGTLLGGPSGTDYCFKFSIYDNATVGAGTKLWPAGAPSSMVVEVTNGVFNVGIGDTGAGGDTLNFNFEDNDTIFLNVEVATYSGSCGSFETLGPRQRIMSSAFAVNANTVRGFAPSQSAVASQIPVLNGSGYMQLGATNPQINATSTNTLTFQGGAGTGDIQFFSGSNKITSSGNMTIAGGLTVGSGATITSGGALTVQSAGATVLTIDAGGAAAINIGGANANALNLGRSGQATTVLGTSTFNEVVTIGNAAGNDNLGFAAEATNPTCSAGNYRIWANSADSKLKKCQNGTITDLDTVGGALTPWTSAVDADGFALQDALNLEFRTAAGSAPGGTVISLYADNSGDLTANVLTAKTFNIAVNGTDEYTFSSTTLDLNSNTITNAGTINGLAITANTGVVTTGTWQGTAVVDTYVADTLTVDSSSSVHWNALNNYPAACSAGSAVSALADTTNTCTAFNTDTSITLQDAYVAGATISTTGANIGLTLNSSQGLTVTTAATGTGFSTFSLADGSNATPPAQLILIDNADTNQAVASGLKITSAAGTITSGIDLTDTDIGDAITLGANNITGAGYSVTSTASGLTLNSTSANLALTTTTSGNITFVPASTGSLQVTSEVTTGTGTSSGLSFVSNSLTSGVGVNLASSSLSSGSLANIVVTGTAAASNTQKALNISTSGANGTSTQTTYGGYFTNTHTGTESTNVAAYLSASGGSNNYALITAGGNVGIGESGPQRKLVVSGDATQTLKAGYLSTDNVLLASLEGGNYFGGVGVKENNWATDNFWVTSTSRDSTRSWTTLAVSSDGKYQLGSVTGGVQLRVSSDYGATWTGVGSSLYWYGAAMSRDGKIQYSADNSPGVGGAIYRSTNYGSTWSSVSGSDGICSLATSSDGKFVTGVDSFCTSGSGQIYTSSDYGATWTARDSNRTWSSITMSSDGKYQTATVYSGLIYTSSDYGATWSSQDSSRNWKGVAMSADGKIQTSIVDGGLVYTSTDYGDNWTSQDSSRSWSSVAMSADGKIQTAVVNSGLVYTSTDYGDNWTSRDSSLAWTSVAMSSDGKIQIAAGSSINVYTSYSDSTILGKIGLGTTAPAGAFHLVAPAQTLASAAGAEYTSGTFTSPTITFTGTTQVTSQMDSFLFNQPTFAGTAATVDNAATMTIAGAPVESGSVVLTNTYGLKINAGAVGSAATSYGLYVDAQTGAGANYAAVFGAGNVGVNDTTPTNPLTVTGIASISSILQVAQETATTYSRFGSATTTHSGAGNIENATDLLLSDDLEVDGDAWFDGNLTVTGTCTGCGGGSFSGEVDDATNDALTFTSDDASAPAGTVNSIFRDNSGDLNINTISGKTLNLQIAGTDKYNFSASALGMNSNNITGLGTTLSATAGLTVGTTSANLAFTTTTSGNITFAPASTGTVQFTSGVTTGTGSTAGLYVTSTTQTSGDMIALNQATSTNTGTGLKMNFANGSGAFTGNFADFQVNGTSRFKVGAGTITTSGASAVAGILQDLILTNGTGSGFQFGNRLLNTVNGGTAGSHVGQFIRMTDSTSLSTGQVVRGLEVQAYSGTNNNGINTGIQTYGKTFGLSAETTGQAGAVSLPAAVFADLNNSTATTVGNAIRAYTNDATSATLVSLYQESSAYTGTGLQLDFGNNAGSFIGNFADFMYQGTSKYKIAYSSSTGKITATYGVSGSIVDFASGTNGNNFIFKIPQNATTTACASGNAEGLIFQDSGGTQRGHICINGPTAANANTLEYFGRAFNVTSTDVAENYSDISNNLVAGDVVKIDTQANKAVTKSKAGDKSVMVGVISTTPGVLLSGIDEANGGNTDLINPKPVALTGRVPVKVTNENGVIAPGDFLTTSDTLPGYAMKATGAGQVIGQALAHMTDTLGLVETFVRPTYYTGTILDTQNDGLALEQEETNDQNIPDFAIDEETMDGIEDEADSGALAITSSATFTEGLRVDSVTSISGLLAFHTDVEFIGRPYFTTDTAGFAQINEGDKIVKITFEKEYLEQPIVNAAISMEGNDDPEMEVLQEEMAEMLFDEGLQYIVINKSIKGFTIVLNKNAPRDLTFSWTAFAVKNPRLFVSGEVEEITDGEGQPFGDSEDGSGVQVGDVVGNQETPEDQQEESGEVAGESDSAEGSTSEQNQSIEDPQAVTE